ncbi:MAG: hypothetical protein N2745_06270 [Syntrophorhabdaceae bacterium]|nr:hypothetical protein [Syntrophorhabdaceae bacterium]
MICDKCGKELDTLFCKKCNNDVLRLGPFCYFCGSPLMDSTVESEDDGIDFENRILCSDGTCIGVVENGVCKVCGKPYVPET